MEFDKLLVVLMMSVRIWSGSISCCVALVSSVSSGVCDVRSNLIRYRV